MNFCFHFVSDINLQSCHLDDCIYNLSIVPILQTNVLSSNPVRARYTHTTLCDKVFHWLATCRWFSPVSSTNKTDRHDITEILLKMALNTIKPLQPNRFCSDEELKRAEFMIVRKFDSCADFFNFPWCCARPLPNIWGKAMTFSTFFKMSKLPIKIMTTEHEYQQCQRHIFLTETLQHRSYQKHALDVHPCSEGSTLFPVGRRGGGYDFLK